MTLLTIYALFGDDSRVLIVDKVKYYLYIYINIYNTNSMVIHIFGDLTVFVLVYFFWKYC